MAVLKINLDGDTPIMNQPRNFGTNQKMQVIITMQQKNVAESFSTISSLCSGLKPLLPQIDSVTVQTSVENARRIRPYLWLFPISIIIDCS